MKLPARLASIRERIARGKQIAFPSLGGGGYPGGATGWGGVQWILPGAEFDYRREAGPVWTNGVVLNAINWITRNFSEARQIVYREDGNGDRETVPDHPSLRLMADPCPYYDASVLWSGTLLSLVADGNAYWARLRDARGRLAGFVYLPHFRVEPYWDLNDPTVFIGGYTYRVNGRDLRLPPEEIVHFRLGLDPLNERKGMSLLAAELKAICTDNEAQTFSAAILRNMGVPSAVLTPKEMAGGIAGQITPEQATKMKADWQDRFAGDNRGLPFITNAPIDVKLVSFSPEQLALDKLAAMPVPRITGAIGLDPMVLGLPSEQRTYSNYGQALEAAYENCLIPLHCTVASQLTKQLMAEFPNSEGLQFGRDYSKVRALQPDLDKQYERQTKAVGGPWLTPNEARDLTGLPPIQGGEVLYERAVLAAPGSRLPAPGAEEDQQQRSVLKEALAAKWRGRRLAVEQGECK